MTVEPKSLPRAKRNTGPRKTAEREPAVSVGPDGRVFRSVARLDDLDISDGFALTINDPPRQRSHLR